MSIVRRITSPTTVMKKIASTIPYYDSYENNIISSLIPPCITVRCDHVTLLLSTSVPLAYRPVETRIFQLLCRSILLYYAHSVLSFGKVNSLYAFILWPFYFV